MQETFHASTDKYWSLARPILADSDMPLIMIIFQMTMHCGFADLQLADIFKLLAKICTLFDSIAISLRDKHCAEYYCSSLCHYICFSVNRKKLPHGFVKRMSLRSVTSFITCNYMRNWMGEMKCFLLYLSPRSYQVL